MIPQAYITEWSNHVPWKTNEQVEQDLVICRALIEIYSDDYLASNLAFRGGTALHKLFLQPQPRYSEDIDLVQLKAEPIKETIRRIQKQLAFINKKSTVEQGRDNNTVKFRFDSEFPPVQTLRLKVEINCKEHFNILGLQQTSFNLESSWHKGSCNITTYKLEELLGTKLRALFQRRKGRNLYDLNKAIQFVPDLNKEAIIECYKKYIHFVVDHPPSQKQFLLNMDEKIKNSEFLGDIVGLIRPEEKYDHAKAWDLVKKELISNL